MSSFSAIPSSVNAALRPRLTPKTETPAPERATLRDADVALAHRQPDSFRQSASAIAAQRSAWAQPPTPMDLHHLVIRGERVPVSFPIVPFDVEPRANIFGALPWRAWARNVSATAVDAAKVLMSPARYQRAHITQLFDPARWHALWVQGNMNLCATPRQDPSGDGVNAVVLHWDGCNSSAQMFEVLRSYGLSAHLLVDSDATVYQLMDLATTKAFHAGWINERSIGIELNNPVDPAVGARQGVERALVREHIPNRNVDASVRLDFTPLQKQRCLELLDVIDTHFSVPRMLPSCIDAAGTESAPTLIDKTYQGVCGHYHVGAHKIDPGLSLWPVIRAHWQKPSASDREHSLPAAA